MRVPHPRVLLVFLSLSLLGACGGSGGGGTDGFSAILVVTNLEDAGPGSLRDALAQAPDNAGIVFDADLPVGSIDLLSPLVIARSVTINGLSGTFQSFTINGGGNVGLFRPDVHGAPHRLALWALVLTGAVNSDGNEGAAIGGGFTHVVLRSVQMFGNHATSGTELGGALAVGEGTLIAEDCAFTANSATNGGGAIVLFTVASTFKRCSFYLNSTAIGTGGAIFMNKGSLRATNCSFLTNQSFFPGGAISAFSTISGPVDVRLYATTVTGNSAPSAGGLHVWNDGSPAHLELHHSIVAENIGGATPDVELTGATSLGINTILGVGGPGLPLDNANGNQVGSLATPVDPQLGAVVIHSVGRAARVPEAASPAVDMVASDALVNDEGPILLDQRALPRADAMSDVGAIER